MRRWGVAFAFLASCGGGGPGGAVGDSAEVAVLDVDTPPDRFELDASFAGYTGSASYAWTCGAGQAHITVSGGISSGSFRLEVFDAAGAAQFDCTFPAVTGDEIRTITKPGGLAGGWTLKFTFNDITWGGEIVLDADTTGAPDEIHVEGGFILSATWQFRPGWLAGPATVEFEGGLSSGSIRIRVWDGAAVLRYDRTFSGAMGGSVSEQTASGAAGVWWVRLEFSNATAGGSISVTQP